jgi:hypothetical protein
MLWTGKIVKALVACLALVIAQVALPFAAFAAADEAPREEAGKETPSREFTRWERVVRGFRREHHFAVTGGILQGSWQVANFGPLRDLQIGDDGFWTRGEYTYHLQIFGPFGYMLGSSTGATYTRTADAAAVKPPTSLIYPGVVAGLVYNISPRIRALGAISVNLERYDGLRAVAPGEQDTEISITMESYDAMAAVDVFATLNVAIRLEGHDRYQIYRRPRNAGDKPVNAGLQRLDRWYGAGLVYHML